MHKTRGAGRKAADPVILVKIVLIQHLFGLKPLWQTVKEIQFNIAYRRFFGLRYTYLRGLARMTAWSGFMFAAMNLKKIASKKFTPASLETGVLLQAETPRRMALRGVCHLCR